MRMQRLCAWPMNAFFVATCLFLSLEAAANTAPPQGTWVGESYVPYHSLNQNGEYMVIRARIESDWDNPGEWRFRGLLNGQLIHIDASKISGLFISDAKYAHTGSFYFVDQREYESFEKFLRKYLNRVIWIHLSESTLHLKVEPHRLGNPFGFELASVACLGKDWSEVMPLHVPAGTYDVQYDPISLAAKGGDILAIAENWILPARGTASANARYEALMTRLEKRAAALPKDHLRERRIACMATCVSTNLMTYRMGGHFNPFTGRWDNAVVGHTTCKGYASIATIVGQRLGVSMRMTGTTAAQHAWSTVWDSREKRWLFLEPQLDECQIFDPHL